MKEKELYKVICAQEPAIPLFLQCWWLDAVCDKWNVKISMKGDQVTGIWPYSITEKLSISFMRTPMLTPYLGPHVFFPKDMKDKNRDSFEHEVITQLYDQLPDADVWNLSQFPGLKQAGLFRNYGIRLEVQQTFLIDLDPTEAEIFSQFKEPLRRNIRAAEKELTITSEPDLLRTLFDFNSATLFNKRVKQAYTLEDMHRLMDGCLANDAGTLWVARENGVVQAIIWNVWDASASYYFMGGKNPEAEGYKAMSALLWHCIKEAKLRGNDVFNLEGSMDPGVERFFRNFCGRRELYLVLKRNAHFFWRMLKRIRK